MDRIYRNFYRKMYMSTGGYFATIPNQQYMLPGDFYQIVHGELIVLGNIFRKGIINLDDANLSKGIKLNSAIWQFGSGVSKAFSSRGTGDVPLGGQFHYSHQMLAFKEEGSFQFSGFDPEAVKIENWGNINQQLIIRMTHGLYSFRDLYIVTESASLSGFSLAVAGASGAELEIATDTENFGLVNIFGHESARTIQSKDIEYFHRESYRKPVFFKSKKLCVKDDRKRVFINNLIKQLQFDPDGYEELVGYNIGDGYSTNTEVKKGVGECLLDMLQANELNANTAISYFTWEDANLDDLEKLFISYESI